jgi:hypothetical protein
MGSGSGQQQKLFKAMKAVLLLFVEMLVFSVGGLMKNIKVWFIHMLIVHCLHDCILKLHAISEKK